MCDCISYNRPEPRQKTRSVFLNPMEYFSYDSIARKVPVDACIADDIRRLWSAGIETGGCCCGHNERKKSVAIKSSCDAEKAREILGDDWEIVAWQLKELAPSAEETLRQQLANSEARVAELIHNRQIEKTSMLMRVSRLSETLEAIRSGEFSLPKCQQLADRALGSPVTEAAILRLQAEAVEAALLHIVTAPHPTTAQQAVEQCAQRLRQQADEAERAGGEQ